MTQTVDFHFDYLSPFAYFAALQLPTLCGDRGVELRYRPVLFAALLDHWGHKGPAEIPPKALHTFKLCARYAALHDIPYRSPRHHPFVPLTALRASLAEVAGDDQQRVVEAIFRAGWSEGADLGSPTDLARALDGAGLDGDALIASTRETEVKQRLREDTEAAIAQGVFGIPTMIVDDELFWGVDQLPYLERYLDGCDPLREIALESLAGEGPAARRPGSERP